MVGAIGGSLLGFALLAVPNPHLWSAVAGHNHVTPAGDCALEEGLVDVVQGDKQILYHNRIPESYQRPVLRDLSAFSAGVSALLRFRNERQPAQLELARARLADANYDVHRLQNRYLYLRERSPAKGWGIYVLDLQCPEGLLVQVPAPLDEWAGLDAGLLLFQRLQGGALAIAGASRHTNADASADVLAEPRSIFETFHRLVTPGNVLVVRGDSREIQRAVFQQPTQPAESAAEAASSILWVKGALPAGLDLRQLKEWLPDYQIQWRTTALTNIIREHCWSGFAELTLSRRDCGVLLRQLATLRNGSASSAAAVRLNRSLPDWLLDRKSRLAERGTDQYVPPKLEELLYLDYEVLRPLLAIARRRAALAELSGQDWDELNAASSAASVVGSEVVLLHDTRQNQDFLILSDTSMAETSRHWGTCVLRCGLSGSAVVEVPRPLAERNTYDYGVNLFTRLEGSVLILAGADPRANLNGTADVTRWANRVNCYNLALQVLLRELRDQPLLVLQVRGFDAPLDTDILVATSNGDTRMSELRQQTRRFLQSVQRVGLRVTFVDGALETAGYEASGIQPALALCQPDNKEFASLWVAPHLRLRFGHDADRGHHYEQFEAADIPTVEVDLATFVQAKRQAAAFAAVPSGVRDLIEDYLRTRDVVALRELRVKWGEFGWTRLIDARTRQVFLVTAGSHPLPLIVNLGDAGECEFTATTCDDFGTAQIESFLDSNATWLEMETE